MKNHQQIYCYDIYIKDMRLFSIDRIEQVELLSDAQTHTEIPQNIDVFGYAAKEMRQAILRLSRNAYLLLKEEMPLSEEYLKEDGGDKYLFTGYYAHFDGICRFILGLGAKEIEVLQPNDLKVELNRRITEGGMFWIIFYAYILVPLIGTFWIYFCGNKKIIQIYERKLL